MRGIKYLQNAMRQHAIASANLRSHPKIGTISGYDPNRPAVKVLFQPEGNESGWIPLGALWVGNGWGMFAAPNLGTQVEVTFLDGNDEAGSANLRFFSNVEKALAVPAGEFWLQHKNGQSVKLTNDGKLTVNDGRGASVALNGDGTIASAGSWSHTGDFNATGTVTGQTQLVAGTGGTAVHVTTHKHPTAATGAPSAPTPGT